MRLPDDIALKLIRGILGESCVASDSSIELGTLGWKLFGKRLLEILKPTTITIVDGGPKLPESTKSARGVKTLILETGAIKDISARELGESVEELSFGGHAFYNQLLGLNTFKCLRKIRVEAAKTNVLPSSLWELETVEAIEIHSSDLEVLDIQNVAPRDSFSIAILLNDIHTIPQQLFSLLDPYALWIASCPVTEMPRFAPNCGLIILRLEDTHISHIDSTLCSLGNLVELSLAFNQICEIPPELATLGNLHSINLSHNQITDCSSFLGELQRREIYCTVNLTGNPLSKDCMQICRNLLEKGMKIIWEGEIEVNRQQFDSDMNEGIDLLIRQSNRIRERTLT